MRTKNLTISLVVTQPDKPAGKHLKITPTPVKIFAQKHDLTLFDHESLNKLPNLLKKKQIDLCIAFAYGCMIPHAVLTLPTYGFWNIHPSLLPQYRGPAPIIYPLILGNRTTGVTLMRMDKGLDTGDIILQKQVAITEEDTKITLEKKIIPIATQLITDAIHAGEQNTLSIKKQKEENATYSRLLNRNDGYIASPLITAALNGDTAPIKFIPKMMKEYWSTYDKDALKQKRPAASIVSQLYKGLYPWPGLWTKIKKGQNQLRVKLLKLHVAHNALFLDQVQVEGKRSVHFKTFIQSYNI